MGLAKVQSPMYSIFCRQTLPSKFDAILGMDIIEHFGKDELVDLLLLAQKALKPNGYMLPYGRIMPMHPLPRYTLMAILPTKML